MTKTLLFVEDDNDKATFTAILRHLNIDNFKIENIDWKKVPKESNPNSPTQLITALQSFINEFSRKKYNKVGIIMDMDNSGLEKMLMTINTALEKAYTNHKIKKLEKVNTLYSFSFLENEEEVTIQFACHFVNLNGKGEIEDILKAIKKQNSPVADCVDEHLKECLKNKHEELRDKDLVKIWINHYQRFDTLIKKERGEANTSWVNVMQKRASDLFDFDRDLKELNELKNFLNLMN